MEKSSRSFASSKEIHTTLRDYFLFASVLMGILLCSIIIFYVIGQELEDFMHIFMGMFFLVFAVFKLLDLKGFVSSFAMYDIIAKKDIRYAYAYPIIELFLSAAYFLHLPFANTATIIILTIGGVGVIQQLLLGRKIRCACLGTYIMLPLTTVSLVEDLMMVAMALILVFNKV